MYYNQAYGGYIFWTKVRGFLYVNASETRRKRKNKVKQYKKNNNKKSVQARAMQNIDLYKCPACGPLLGERGGRSPSKFWRKVFQYNPPRRFWRVL